MEQLDPERSALATDRLSPAVRDLAARRLVSRDFDEWADQLARVGNCSHPVRLRGASHTVDTRTGEVVSTYSSLTEPDGLARVRCGNRREAVCPACSREYAADTWHLIASGVAGGKGVPETVGRHPMVFATLTAPSFGIVHSGSSGKTCRGRRLKTFCRHGRRMWCNDRHEETDAALGQPLCLDCYDYAEHVVWQWHAPELWRRFTIALRRSVASSLGVSASRLNDVATLQFAKVAEFQRRGVVHFHALIRIDGPRCDDGFAAPPASITAEILADLIQSSTTRGSTTAPPVHAGDAARELSFGSQVDTQAVQVTEAGGQLSASQVAGYIAKYATKSAPGAGPNEISNAHVKRLRRTVRQLADAAADDGVEAYELLGKWEHMLGFRGHFSSKSRRYSTTLGSLRGARRQWQRRAAIAHARGVDLEDLALADEDETFVVLGSWQFAGMGWRDDGETALAEAAAARAREWQAERAAHRHAMTA